MPPSADPHPGRERLRRGAALRAGAVPSFLMPDPHPPVRIGYVLLRGGSDVAAAALRAGAVPSFLTPDPHPPVRIGYVLQRGCRAPARRVLGRRVRYVIGAEPGQVPGRRWRCVGSR
jgi:hypothetical protein